MSSVSVFIPCYNYGRFLRECTRSVLTQEGVDVSVLIIDDASTDDSPQVASELARQDPRIEISRHAKNHGHIATYNEGLAWAKGRYTALLSADDLFTPGALLRATRLLDAHPEVGFVTGKTITFRTDGVRPEPATVSGNSRWQIRAGQDWFEERCRVAENNVAAPGVVVRTSLQRELGGYREDLPHSGDLEMWLRFAVHSAVGRLPDAEQAYYRIHDENMSWTRFSAVSRLKQREAAFEAIFRDYGRQIPDAERLRHLMYRGLASDALWWVCRALYRREATRESVTELLRFAASTHQDREPQDSERLVRLGRQGSYLAASFLEGAPRWSLGWWRARRPWQRDSPSRLGLTGRRSSTLSG
jgi:glycosyltransferase involved in cell wall biosynthesis